MSGRFFLDTSLLIYAIDASDPGKQAIGQKWIAAAHESGDGQVSYQVVQEWFSGSLVVSATIQGGCDRLLSEDLQHGQKIRGVRIVNPFRTTSVTTLR